MRRERVADDIYVFTSELYAQVTAGVIVTPEGAVLIDTMVFPDDAKLIKRFIEEKLETTVKYIINTHYHADHTYGNCFFENAVIISHALCYDLLNTAGRDGLKATKQNSPSFDDVDIVTPHILFDEEGFVIHIGNKTLELAHSPGHSPDSIVIHAREDRVLFAGDTLMPIPYFVDGDIKDFRKSLNRLKNQSYENIVQGHGEIVLRGEVEQKIEEDLDYLDKIEGFVKDALKTDDPEAHLREIDIEQVGKSRILLNGGIEDLHQTNMLTLLRQMQKPKKSRRKRSKKKK